MGISVGRRNRIALGARGAQPRAPRKRGLAALPERAVRRFSRRHQDRDDIKKLPFTDKAELVEDTDMFLGVVPDQIVETVVTSGSPASRSCFP